MKRIVICSDGTWNRPEQELDKDVPTNVLKVARAIRPVDDHGVEQVVFYDWGIGSYYDEKIGGATGRGINKNIQDAYRFLVQNHESGDEIFLFGFSRGAYTVRSLSGMIYNCGIIRRRYAERIAPAFELYKDPDVHPMDDESKRFRTRYSGGADVRVRFIGVWDTVGALGVPLSFAGLLNDKHLFHDVKLGPNVDCARHALAIDELREDFEPTIWKTRRNLDLEQVWFAGVHSDVGGGYGPRRGARSSDAPLEWMVKEARANGLAIEDHLDRSLSPSPVAELHRSYEGFFKLLGKSRRRILRSTRIHRSVRERYEADETYRPRLLEKYLDKYGWPDDMPS